MLNEQFKELIKRDAEGLYDCLNEKAQEVDSYDFGLPMANRQTQPIVGCLTQYAEKWQEAQHQAEQLIQWKKETKLLLDPILDWGQSNKNVPLGASITEEVLRRAKEYDELKERAERYEKALKEIAGYSGLVPPKQGMIDIAREVLTPKTGSDERRL